MAIPTGAIRYNTDSNKMECFNGTKWMQVVVSESVPIGARGLCWGGYASPGTVNTIDFITIATGGTATDFGDGTWAGGYTGGTGTRTRGFLFGGYVTAPGSGPQLPSTAPIDYVEIATQGNAADFGDLTVARGYPAGACSQTRGLFAGGFIDQKDEIDYITIATTGNAVDFGNLVRGKWIMDGAVSSGTRAVFGNGSDGSSPFGWKDNRVDYVTIATTGNATDFGDYDSLYNPSAAQSSTRGIWMGGRVGPAGPAWITRVVKIEIDTLGNPMDFGDLSVARGRQSGLSNSGGGT